MSPYSLTPRLPPSGACEPGNEATTLHVCVCLMCRQSVLIAVLVKLGALPESWKEYDVEDVSLGLQVDH